MKKIPFNENYFSIDQEKSFYWAGFLAADGCIRNFIQKLTDTSNTHIKVISFKKDKEMIEQFLSDLDCKGRKINEYCYQTLKGNAVIYGIDLKSHKMYDDLLRFGLKDRKSKTLEIPDWLQNHYLVSHFIRGYFDGDGSIFFQRKSKYIEFRGTVPFLKAINFIIKII